MLVLLLNLTTNSFDTSAFAQSDECLEIRDKVRSGEMSSEEAQEAMKECGGQRSERTERPEGMEMSNLKEEEKIQNEKINVKEKTTQDQSNGGGCLIATAAYGTELSPQVQFLREIRDNTVMSTSSGMAFITAFNQVYYSFSPTIADWERENPMFQEAVRSFITPMVSTLSIMTLADGDSEIEVLGLGISVIALNLGIYIGLPILTGFKVKNMLKNMTEEKIGNNM